MQCQLLPGIEPRKSSSWQRVMEVKGRSIMEGYHHVHKTLCTPITSPTTNAKYNTTGRSRSFFRSWNVLRCRISLWYKNDYRAHQSLPPVPMSSQMNPVYAMPTIYRRSISYHPNQAIFHAFSSLPAPKPHSYVSSPPTWHELTTLQYLKLYL